MNSSPASRVRHWLQGLGIAPAALVLALAGAFLTWLFFEGALLQPWAQSNNTDAQSAALGFLGVIKVLLVAAPVVALWRPWSALAMALPMVIWVFLTGANVPMGLYVGLLAVAVASAFRSTRSAIAGLNAALVPIAAVCAVWRPMAVPFGTIIDQQYASWRTNLMLFGVYALVSVCLVGVAFLLRARVGSAREREQLAVRSREVATDAAVTEERARLARDLHDVVAHHVSLIAVRAETAPFQHPDLGESARSVLTEIGADARSALEELRGVLGVLRRSEHESATAPQPGAEDIAALVDRARESGQEVDFDGSVPHMNSTAGYAAYRIVQESLTNARRHAPAQSVSVHLRGGGVDHVDVSVLNRRTDGTGQHGEGRGLAGMRERVEALGGDFAAATIGTDFVVQARIPSGLPADLHS